MSRTAPRWLTVQTYYLAVDLSYPEMLERASRAPHHSRGGYYKNWLDQHPERPHVTASADRDDQNENDEEPEIEARVDDDEPEIDPRLLASDKGKGVDRGPITSAQKQTDVQQQNDGEKQEDMEDIQILDFHSKNPLISYKGRVFEGQWAEVIGTEAIFANHDADRPLPALRNLAGDVDLLGASAARMLTKEKIVKPKVPEEDPLAAIKQEWNIRIPVGKDRTGERAQQTRFLENLMALKKKKGERDQVTVYARDGEGKDFKDNRDPDYKPRRRRRLLNEDGEEIMIPKRERKRSGRPAGRPRSQSRGRGHGRWGGATTATAAAATPWENDGARVGTRSAALSTPTPERWDDLGDDDEEDEDGGDEEGQSEGGRDMSEDEEVDDEDEEDDEDITMID